MVSVGPLVEFSYVADQQTSPRGQRFWRLESFLLFWSACGRVWVSVSVRFYVLFPYVSEVAILGARWGGLSLWIRGASFFP